MSKYNLVKYSLKSYERIPVEVVDISTIASIGIADGKTIPVIFLDTSKKTDIREAIVNHRFVKMGDVSAAWIRNSKQDYKNLFLLVELKNPTECRFIIHFIIDNHGHGIDMIVQNGGCYLQSSSDGTNISQSPNAPRILTEVTIRDFQDEWNRLYQIGTTKMFKKRCKISSKKASQMAESFISEMRKTDIRMK